MITKLLFISCSKKIRSRKAIAQKKNEVKKEGTKRHAGSQDPPEPSPATAYW